VHVRRKLVVGNWKMNGSLDALSEVIAIADGVRELSGIDVAICPPFTLIAPAVMRAAGAVRVGAQDIHGARSGAYTGCVSAAMVKEAGATLAIVGHSERRTGQHETDGEVRAKAEAGLAAGLDMIVCVGESDEQRRSGDHIAVVERQLAASLPDDIAGGELIVAYEPIWAIGTGNVATASDVGEMHATLRAALVARYGDAGEHIRILYGGSVKPDNSAELFGVSDVDGALVGGASLTAGDFLPIVEAAARS